MNNILHLTLNVRQQYTTIMHTFVIEIVESYANGLTLLVYMRCVI